MTITRETMEAALKKTREAIEGTPTTPEPSFEAEPVAPPEPWFTPVKTGRKSKGQVTLSEIIQTKCVPNYKFSVYDCPDELKKYIPKIDKNFVPDKEYALALLQAIDMNETLTAYGPPGSGKTETVAQICAWLGRPYIFLSGMGGTDPSDYIGMNTIEDGDMKWCNGDLSFAVENGLVCLFDEPFKCSATTLMCIQSLIDDRRTLKLYGQTDMDKATLPAHPEFRLVLADNVRGVGDNMHKYAAEVQDQSTLNRSMFKVKVGYPEADVEVAILKRKNPTAHPEFLKSVVAIGGLLRKAWEEDSLSLPYSLRDTNNFVRLAMIEGSAAAAFRKTYFNAASDEEQLIMKKIWQTVGFQGERL
jgi:MoxR-like ATPase